MSKRGCTFWPSAAATLLAVCPTLLGTGCQSAPDRWRPPPVEDYFRRHKENPPSAWFRIYIDGELKGYLRDSRESTGLVDFRTTYWIYDANFGELGFVTEYGRTFRTHEDGFRATRNGQGRELGVYQQDRAILVILGIPPYREVGEGENVKDIPREVGLSPMPRVWDLEEPEPEPDKNS